LVRQTAFQRSNSCSGLLCSFLDERLLYANRLSRKLCSANLVRCETCNLLWYDQRTALIVKENTLCGSERAWYEPAFSAQTEQELLSNWIKLTVRPLDRLNKG
jgi:hypothetical protein